MSPSAMGHIAMLVFSALVAGSFSLGVMAANHIAPAALTAPRFALGAALVGIAALFHGGISRASMQAPWRYAILGALFGAYFVLMFEGLKTAPPVSAAAVFTLMPVMAAGFGWLVLRQVTTKRMALALGIGGLGALWVIFRADLSQLLAFQVGRGEYIYFIGCIAHALYIPLIRRLNRGESALQSTFWMMVAAAILVTIYGWGDLRQTDWGALPGIVWITLAYLVVASTAMSFVLLQFASLHLPATKVTAYTFLTPAWVILWELALGNGAPPMWVAGGMVLIVIALGLMLRD